MKFIKFIKDVYARKKLIRFRKPWLIKTYDLRREIALFWDTPAYMPENSNKEQYEQLVAVNGTGTCTGSGAICDFLREFDECTVLGGGHNSKNEQYKHSSKNVNEFDYWKDSNSVLLLEEVIFQEKFHSTRAGALDFSIFTIRNMHSKINIFDDYYLQRSKKFLFDLIDFHWRWSLGYWTQTMALGQAKKNMKQYTPAKLPKRFEYDDIDHIQIVSNTWKDFTLKEYRAHAKKYFEDWLKHLPSKKFLVLDQLMGSRKFDGELFEDYFGDIKMIYVWRDPRDQYAICKNANLSFIPDNPLIFIKRYKKILNNILSIKHKNVLIVRFEELVIDYDKISRQTMDFLSLDLNKHTKKFYYFDPKISIKTIGTYKTYHDQEAIKMIERELYEYCWNK